MLELRQHKERVENIQRQIIMQPTYSQLNTLCGGARLILLDANEFIPNRDFKNLDAYRGYGDHVNSYVRWYCNRNRKVEGDEWDKLYWQTYLNGARARIFNDYLLFLEHKREPRKMFYKPKIKQFEKFQLIESYQGMLDDKYDILCISMPPGTGKAQPLYSKVLTPNGFVQMGDLKVGDKVFAANGNESTITGIFPQGLRKIYEITLENGYKCRASDNHLWLSVYETSLEVFECQKVVETSRMLYKPTHFYIPCISGENFNHFEYCRIKSIKYVGLDECQCIYIDDPSHLYVTDDYIVTHNTTLLKFFHSAVIGWFPDDYSLFYSHSGDITRMYYDGVYQMVDDALEYAWHDIFPDLKITSTNALMQQFNVGKYKPFPSLQTTSVGAKSAGKVRASKFLLTDDMIGSLEEALNKNYLDKMWGAYTVDALQRKTVDSNNNPCKEIMQATRWSTQDVIGRLIDIYDGNNRVRVISIPATDPETGDSNFDYAIGGFTKEFFAKQALLMDDVSYNCLYMQQPVEREGLLFPEEKIMRYKELPTSKIERITAQADTKSTGTDFFVLPVLIKYEGKDLYYCVDCVCSSSPDYEAQYENSANLLVDNKVEDCEFESNNGGDRVSLEVNKRVLKKGWICNISFRATETNKEARIYQCSNWILQHVVFKDKKLYTPKEPYGVMMSLLVQYSTSGKKQLDDVPDTFANFALRIQRRKPRPTRIINSIY
mgnify:FL=1